MMEAKLVILVCVLAAAADAARTSKITVWHDRPGLRLAISEIATMQCCYSSTNENLIVKWMKHVMISNNMTESSFVNDTFNRVKVEKTKNKIINTKELKCSNLILDDIVVNDTALYQCALTEENTNSTPIYTPGTFLQVYEPINMILGISETSKNSIITAEGVFLLLFVLLPGIALICKSKGLNELEKRKGREEENIYEGLNLDDCNSTYHQIQRSLVQGPYQDVINTDEDDIQLEKP